MPNKKIKKHLRIVWQNIRNRCLNPNNPRFKDYGGRGIKICKKWSDFETFFNDMSKNYKPGLQIERIKNNRGYSPSNCKWASKTEQANNKRNSHFITHNGQTKTLAEWAKDLNIPYTALISRINKHKWPLDKALTKRVAKPAKERLVKWRGKTYNISTWSKITGIGETTLQYRLKAGFSVEDLFKKPSPRRKQRFKDHHIEWNNEKLLISEWAKKLNINYGTLISRFKMGWPLKRIMKTPPGPNGRKSS